LDIRTSNFDLSVRAKTDNNSSIWFQASAWSREYNDRTGLPMCGRRSSLGALAFATTRHFVFPFIYKYPTENNKPRVAGPPERKSWHVSWGVKFLSCRIVARERSVITQGVTIMSPRGNSRFVHATYVTQNRRIDEKKESCERSMAGALVRAFLLITPLFLRPERNNVSCNSSETAEVYSCMCACMRMLHASKYAPFIAPAMIRRYAVNRSCFSTKLSLLLRRSTW